MKEPPHFGAAAIVGVKYSQVLISPHELGSRTTTLWYGPMSCWRKVFPHFIVPLEVGVEDLHLLVSLFELGVSTSILHCGLLSWVKTATLCSCLLAWA